MQEPFLVPTECARLLQGPNLMLPFLPNPFQFHTKEIHTRQDHSINWASSPKTAKRKTMLCPSESQIELGVSPPEHQDFCICLPQHSLFLFAILRPDSEAQLSMLPAEGRTRGLAAFPQAG